MCEVAQTETYLTEFITAECFECLAAIQLNSAIDSNFSLIKKAIAIKKH